MKNSKQKRKRKGSGEILEKRKRKTPQNCKSPTAKAQEAEVYNNNKQCV